MDSFFFLPLFFFKLFDDGGRAKKNKNKNTQLFSLLLKNTKPPPQTLSPAPGAPLARSAVDVVLCGRSDRSASRFFDGRVAQLALFDEALSPAAVEALWKAAGGKKTGPPRAGTSASAGVAAEATAAAARLAREADARDAELDAMLLKAKSGASAGSGSSGPSAAGGGAASAAAAATQASSDEGWTAGPVPKPPPGTAPVVAPSSDADKHGRGAKHAPAALSSAAKLQAESERVAALERQRKEKGHRLGQGRRCRGRRGLYLGRGAGGRRRPGLPLEEEPSGGMEEGDARRERGRAAAAARLSCRRRCPPGWR